MKENITIKSDLDCTGCGLCQTVCPSSSIHMRETEDGYHNAAVHQEDCISCRKCISVCPRFVETPKSATQPLAIYAATNKQMEVRLSSSSGGVADIIANTYLARGYKIVGAVYDTEENCVKHRIIDRQEDLIALRGSKYLSSLTQDAFSQLSQKERYVIFGTPCQIYGLRKSMESKKLSPETILVDLYCHGVPSMHLWRKYLAYLEKYHGIENIKKVNFRDKSTGWHTYSMRIDGNGKIYRKKMNDDLFYNFYLSNLCLNKPCYSCSFRQTSIASDIRLGDFWGPKYQQDKQGVSLLNIMTETGRRVWEKIQDHTQFEAVSQNDLLQAQPPKTIAVPEGYERVMASLKGDMDLKQLFNITLRRAYLKRKLILMIKGLFPRSLKQMVKKIVRR